MSAFVLDCSVAIAWCFEDEAADDTDALLEQARDEGALVPSLWHLEVGNVLVMAERRGRIMPPALTAVLALLSELPIAVDELASRHAWVEVTALARAEQLSVYDAAYLELALRRRLPLATKDRALGAAARRAGVPVLPG